MTPPAVNQIGVEPVTSQDQITEADLGILAFRRILVALDASDHANRGLSEAARLAGLAQGSVTGIHAYAARLHDRRFRQMEGGLPERYRREAELERQRAVHDDLISRGLRIISDSYHDVAAAACREAQIPYRALSPEGKNYRRIAEAAKCGEFDLLVLGALGLGATTGALVGSVCERVARRSPIDVLVIRDPKRRLGDGPIVVGLDGSARSFGALRLALDLGRRLGVPVHAVAAYDPYFHYVAFKKIAGALSEEKGREFRFEQQEKLHEELIDDGLAKIYRSHLDVAKKLAAKEFPALVCELLDGKPHQAILRYVQKAGASAVFVGRTGVHADAELDIGGTAENLMRLAPCHVWLGTSEFAPPMETLAAETMQWTTEAEQSLARVPEAVRNMVRMAILRFASERGHTVITSRVMNEATAALCPHSAGAPSAEQAIEWSPEASAILEAVEDHNLKAGIRLRAQKKARRDRRRLVMAEDVRPFVNGRASGALTWEAAALARLARVPDIVRESVRARIEDAAIAAGVTTISRELVKAAIAESKLSMAEAMAAGGHKEPPPAGG
jgi:nucleotide-binding universal stress UspA family protein